MKRVLMLDENPSYAYSVWQDSGCDKLYELSQPWVVYSTTNIDRALAAFQPDVIIVSKNLPDGLTGPGLMLHLRRLSPAYQRAAKNRGAGRLSAQAGAYNGLLLVNEALCAPFLQAGLIVHGKTGRTAQGLEAELRRVFTPPLPGPIPSSARIYFDHSSAWRHDSYFD